MKAIVMTSTGGPEVLEYQEVTQPALPGEHELLVKVRAAGVNPVDTKLRASGTYFPEGMPAILGCDGAGVVEKVGKGVTRFLPGDEVYYCNGGIGQPAGNYTEYHLVDERYAARKPASLGFIEAAAAPLVLITAWESLHDRGRIQPGQRVLIHAGAGGVGHVAIQLAKLAGAEIFTTISSSKTTLVTGLGADHCIHYQEQEFSEVIMEMSAGKGVDLALDTVGGATFEKTVAAMARYGDLVTLLQLSSTMDWKQARLRNLRISLELMLSPMFYQDHAARQHQTWILEQCATLFEQRKLKIHVSHTLPLAQAAEAHRLIERGSMSGKIVLEMDTQG